MGETLEEVIDLKSIDSILLMLRLCDLSLKDSIGLKNYSASSA